MANNVCRLFFADPEFYKSRHVFHHSRFGTSEDGAFTNFVLPRRFLLCLLPLAGILPFNDYKIHAGEKFTRSRIISELLSFANLLGFAAAMTVLYGFWFAAFVLVLGGPWVAFVLDRLRETTEHNLMPTHFKNGARSFGPGFWGFLVGGGPWGQPCHLMHHLAPSLPWYMQLGMHLEVKALMTSEQRRAFMVRPVFGYPLLVAHVLRQTFALSRQVVAADLSRTRAQTPNFGR
jgi:fatty acid desaturase